ncbi:MAG: hypothetical protein WDO15_01420 [Bacteroidota bacterium]
MKLQDAIDLVGLATTPLINVTDNPVFEKKINKDVEESSGNFELKANANSSVKVKLFNDKDDDTDDNLATDLQLDNTIIAGDAFLSYDLSCELASSIALTAKELELGISASGHVRHVTFKRHKNTELLAAAIANDLLDLNSIVSAQSITNLKDEETVALFTTASFEFKGTFKIAESFTPVLSALSKLIGTASPIKASIDLSASFSGSVAIKDDLAIIIQCTENAGTKSFIIDIKKDYSKDLSLGGSLGAVASFDNPEVIEDRIVELIGQGEKFVIEKAEQLRNVVPVTDEQIKTIKAAALKLGIDIDGKIEDIKKKYFDKKDDVIEKIKNVLNANITLAATFEYKKQMSRQSLLHGRFTAPAISEQFKSILRAKVLDIYEASKNTGKGITEIEVFQKESISITRTTKFGLSIGDIFELSDTIQKAEKLTQEIKGDPLGEYQEVQLSSSKVLTKKMGSFQTRVNSMVLDGEVKSNSINAPKVKDIQFGFSIKWSENYKKLPEFTFKSIMDFGMAWEIFDKTFYTNELNAQKGLIKRKVNFSAVLSIKNGSFNKIMGDMANVTDQKIAEIVSGALPWGTYFGRGTPGERVDAYKVYAVRLANRKVPIDYDDSRNEVSEELSKLSSAYGPLATFEAQDRPNNPNRQVADVFWVNAFPYHFKNSFLDSIKDILNNGDSLVENFFKDRLSAQMMKIGIKDELNIRFLGLMILSLSTATMKQNEIERTLVIDYTDDAGVAQKIVYAK